LSEVAIGAFVYKISNKSEKMWLIFKKSSIFQKVTLLKVFQHQYGPLALASFVDIFTEALSLEDDPENGEAEV